VAKSSRQLANIGISIGILSIVFSIILTAVGPLYADLVGNHTTDKKIEDIEYKINRLVQDSSSGPLDIDENTKEELGQLSNSSSHYLRGLSETLSGNFEVAESEFSMAIDQQTSALSKNYLQRGNVRYLSGNYLDALEDFTYVTNLDPKDALAWDAKGVALAALGRHDEALNAANKAIELDPKLAVAWNSKGAALAALGRHDEALNAFNKAIELDPNLADAWNNKGEALKALGRTTEANAAFTEAKELGYIS